MFDLSMQLCANKSIATAITSDAYDFGQEKPNSGAWASPIYLVVHPTVAGTGTGTTNAVTFILEDSADGSTFAPVASLGAVPGADIKHDLALSLPVRHRRYVRLKTSVTGTVTGTVTAYLSNGYSLPMDVKKGGIDAVAGVD